MALISTDCVRGDFPLIIAPSPDKGNKIGVVKLRVTELGEAGAAPSAGAGDADMGNWASAASDHGK